MKNNVRTKNTNKKHNDKNEIQRPQWTPTKYFFYVPITFNNRKETPNHVNRTLYYK